MQTYRQRAERIWLAGTEALSAFADEVAARKTPAREPATILRLSPTGIDVLRRLEGREERLFSARGRPQDAVKQVTQALGAKLGDDCIIDIGASLSVTGRMVLPAGADTILQAIIRNKVEGIAPWPLAQSVYGQRIVPVPGDAAHVAVDVAVVSRALLDDIARALAEAGCTVRSSTLTLQDGESLALDFGIRSEIVEARRRALKLASGVGLAAAVAAALGMLLVWQAHAGLSAVQAETARLGATLGGQAGETATRVEAANLLHERRRQRLPAAAVLEELSRVLPQTVWLESLSLDDLRLELRGQGSAIPGLIESLEQSDAFSDVNFSSATQFNADLNAETFSIGATLEAAREITP